LTRQQIKTLSIRICILAVIKLDMRTEHSSNLRRSGSNSSLTRQLTITQQVDGRQKADFEMVGRAKKLVILVECRQEVRGPGLRTGMSSLQGGQ
jgi:hypothetical protein